MCQKLYFTGVHVLWNVFLLSVFSKALLLLPFKKEKKKEGYITLHQ